MLVRGEVDEGEGEAKRGKPGGGVLVLESQGEGVGGTGFKAKEEGGR